MTATAKRYHEFDALRGFAMLLGIVLHGALSFVFLPIWPAQDMHQNSGAYGFLQHAIHGFRMPIFFLISGFFTAMMWRKRGVKGLVVHRAKRILLPLIVGTILVWPLMILVGHWGAMAKAQRADRPKEGSNIWTAAKEGDVEGLRRMIEAGADVNERDLLRVSPTEWAAMYDSPEAIALLVENGAGVDARNEQGSTPLHAAAFLGRTGAVRKLVELGADPGAKNTRGDTPLAAATMDMAFVHFIAGALQMQIDGEAVAASRRETAAYLRGLEVPGMIGPDSEGKVGVRAAVGGRETGGATSEGRGGRSERNQLWGIVLGITLGVTFFPVFHHLWFLYYLLWLVVLFLVAVWVRRWMPFPIPRWITDTPWCFLWLIPLTLLPQLFMTQTFGVDTAPGLLPWPPTLVYYAVFFGYGALCFGRPEFEERAGRYWGLLFLAAVPILLAGLQLFEARGARTPSAHALMSFCAVVYAWLMAFGLIGFFRRFFSREDRRIRYLSDSSYWLYLAHLPLIIGLQVWVSNWELPSFPKFLLVCALTFAILIVFYEYVVRYTFIGTGLNGKKTRGNTPRAQLSAAGCGGNPPTDDDNAETHP